MKGSIAVIVALAGSSFAEGDPALAKLEQSLPAGWSLLATDTELVIRHDRPCYVESGDAPPMITLELRYRLEPKWSDKQLAEARAANDKVAKELRGLRAQYQIDKIHDVKAPRDADERKRLDAYAKGETELRARIVKLPLCALGASSVFDGDDTYAQLKLVVDPPDAMREAHHVVELVKKQCGAK